jgi:hypothetical protein
MLFTTANLNTPKSLDNIVSLALSHSNKFALLSSMRNTDAATREKNNLVTDEYLYSIGASSFLEKSRYSYDDDDEMHFLAAFAGFVARALSILFTFQAVCLWTTTALSFSLSVIFVSLVIEIES